MRDRHSLRRHLGLWNLILLLGLLFPVAAQAQEEKPRILIVPYRVDPRIPVEPATANAILAARMSKLKTFSIISQEELEAMATYQAQLQALGEADDVDALKRLGEAANADRLVSGMLGDVGGTVTATLTLLNVRTGEVEKRVAGTAKGARDLILPLLNRQADAILAHMLRTYAPEKVGSARAAPAPAAPAPVAATETPRPRLWTGIGAVALALTSGALGFAVASLGSALLTALVVLPALPSNQGWLVAAGMGGAGAVALLVSGLSVVGVVVAVVMGRSVER